MIRKLLVVAAAIALPVSIVAVTGGMAGASNPHLSGAAGDSVSCKSITGTVKFSPGLSKAGMKSGHTTTTVTATLTGCTVTGSTPITITKGSVKGTIVGATGTSSKPTGTCTGLAGNSTDNGKLTTTWTASKGGPVPSSVLTVKSVSGGTAGGHGTFTIPGSVKGSATGSFLGANNGGSDKSIAETTPTTSALLTGCLAHGLATLGIQTETGKTAATLG